MRIFRNKPFSRFAKKNGIPDESLREAVRRAMVGLIDADLGAGIIKQRIARKGEGKSGGYRSIIVLRGENRAVFIHGFAKKDIENISDKDLRALKKLARIWLNLSDAELDAVLKAGTLIEVDWNG